MLEIRPRVRAGGGLYVLKYQQAIKYERDMFTEIPAGAILESVYYRYLYFFEDGRVMYALTHATPLEMIPRFVKMLLHGRGSKDKWGVWGRYQIARDVVRVWAAHSWHEVSFQLRVIPSNGVFHYDSGDRGVCTTIALEMHMSSASGNFEDDSQDLVKYDIPSHCYFRFLKDKRL
jgi:F-box protein 9